MPSLYPRLLAVSNALSVLEEESVGRKCLSNMDLGPSAPARRASPVKDNSSSRCIVRDRQDAAWCIRPHRDGQRSHAYCGRDPLAH